MRVPLTHFRRNRRVIPQPPSLTRPRMFTSSSGTERPAEKGFRTFSVRSQPLSHDSTHALDPIAIRESFTNPSVFEGSAVLSVPLV